MSAGILVFVATYILISARRLGVLVVDRPAGSLLGAVACVALGVLTPDQAMAAVDDRTIVLLFGMMGMGAFLGAEGFFDRATQALAAWAGTRQRLLGALIWGAGGLSALVTNDAVCVLGAPLVVELVRRYRLPAFPFLLALATAANTGSVATLVGNPQNMLCASLGGLSYLDHLLLVGPVGLAGLAINHGIVALAFRKELAGRIEATERLRVLTPRTSVVLGVIGATVLLYSLGADLAWTSAAGCCVLLVTQRVEPGEIWRRIDWSILLFFGGLFVVVEGFVRSGGPAWFFDRFALWSGEGTVAWLRVAAIQLFGSNVVSNVPFILVVKEEMSNLPDPKRAWEMLAMASTFAGNLTLLGSVANIIVAEKGHDVGGLPFWAYLKIGMPLALVTTAVGALWIAWLS